MTDDKGNNVLEYGDIVKTIDFKVFSKVFTIKNRLTVLKVNKYKCYQIEKKTKYFLFSPNITQQIYHGQTFIKTRVNQYLKNGYKIDLITIGKKKL